MARKSGRNADGAFAAGNPGKPRGTRHKATRAALALLDGEAEALTRKAVELALGGARPLSASASNGSPLRAATRRSPSRCHRCSLPATRRRRPGPCWRRWPKAR